MEGSSARKHLSGHGLFVLVGSLLRVYKRLHFLQFQLENELFVFLWFFVFNFASDISIQSFNTAWAEGMGWSGVEGGKHGVSNFYLSFSKHF